MTTEQQAQAAGPRAQEFILEIDESLFVVCPLQAAGAFHLFHLHHLKAACFSMWRLICFISCTAEGFGWGKESAGSAHAAEYNACVLSIMNSALSTGTDYFFLCVLTQGEHGRTKCHHCAL